MKTLKLEMRGGVWFELRQDGRRYLLEVCESGRPVVRRWWRNLIRACDDFVEVCGLDDSDLHELLGVSERKSRKEVKIK